MRLTSGRGLAVRAAGAAGATAFVLLASVAFAVVIGGTVALYVLAFAPEGRAALAVLALGAVAGVCVLAFAIRRFVRAERERLLEGTYAVDDVRLEAADDVVETVRRLALQADAQVPTVHVHPAWTPLAYTTHRPSAPIVRSGDAEPVLVVSRGVLDRLDDDRREAVLAHEVAHLANDDLRLVTWLLVPLYAAESLTNAGHPIVAVPGAVLLGVATLAVGAFTRGREVAADRGAAAITGDPAALAAALERLHETRTDNQDPALQRPEDDLRSSARTTSAVNVLPVPEHDRSWAADADPDSRLAGLATAVRAVWATHPPLSVRLEELQSLADGDAGGRGRSDGEVAGERATP